ncbi:hypothetical protein GCM10007884_17560 [Methylobacterium brachythecii]|uniref:Uncharacterized protein n=1 Tax=Methylobacterium brachythecii TaxID=1176177 RepID=A0ABQ6D168_9HYPH|nr:hypothetical protein GCM10007884_17560 [Methylobacterium brachythecii]
MKDMFVILRAGRDLMSVARFHAALATALKARSLQSRSLRPSPPADDRAAANRDAWPNHAAAHDGRPPDRDTAAVIATADHNAAPHDGAASDSRGAVGADAAGSNDACRADDGIRLGWREGENPEDQRKCG